MTTQGESLQDYHARARQLARSTDENVGSLAAVMMDESQSLAKRMGFVSDYLYGSLWLQEDAQRTLAAQFEAETNPLWDAAFRHWDERTPQGNASADILLTRIDNRKARYETDLKVVYGKIDVIETMMRHFRLIG